MSDIKIATSHCLKTFATLSETLSKSKGGFEDDMPLEKIIDEQGRFKVWSGNIGALQGGHSSLDWRLREADAMRLSILRLLEDLHDALGQCEFMIA